MDIKSKLAEWGINAVGAFAAGAGAIVQIVLNEKEISFRRSFLILCSGFFLGAYGTGIIAKKYDLNTPEGCGFIGIILGIAGMYIAKAIINYAKKIELNPEGISKLFKKKSDDGNS